MTKEQYAQEYLLNATGQNNTRFPQFAVGQQGAISITGELGPELRIKEDGSMDLVG